MGIMDWQQKADQRMREVLPTRQAEGLIRLVGFVRSVKGSDAKFKRFAGAKTAEEVFDIHAEITYALIFMGVGFGAEFEPLGEEGPDLMVTRDGHSAYVEVKRFRNSAVPGARNLSDPDGIPIFQQYGNPLKDIAKIRGELMKKFRQVREGNGIVAFWSDNDHLDIEFPFAVTDVREDVYNQIQTVPEGFLFSVFASDSMAVRQHQQIYCRSVSPLQEPSSTWVYDLESSLVDDCIRSALRMLRGNTPPGIGTSPT